MGMSSVPWTKLAASPEEYIEKSIPMKGQLREPSYIIRANIEAIYEYWYGLQDKEEIPLQFFRHKKAGVTIERGKSKGHWMSPGNDGSESGEECDDLVQMEDETNNETDDETKDEIEDETKDRKDKDGELETKVKGNGKALKEQETPVRGESICPTSPAAASNWTEYLAALSNYPGYVKALKLLAHAVSFCLFQQAKC